MGRAVFFRYIGPDESMRRWGVGWLVYEKAGQYYAADTHETVCIDERLYRRERA